MNKPTFIYTVLDSQASIVATDTASGYAAENVLSAAEDTAWKPANTTGEKTLEIDFGPSVFQDVGQIAIIGKQLDGVTLSINELFGAVRDEISAAAVISTTNNCTYRTFTQASRGNIELVFAGMSSSTEIIYVAICPTVPLPYLEDGHDPDSYTTEGTHLIGTAGTYLGSTQQRSMLTLSLSFGQVTAAQYAYFAAWAEACIKTMRPFFYVPDTDQPECLFGWVDAKYKFSAPYKNGLRKIAAIPFNARKL